MRRAARITHDEVCRMVKAAKSCGLSIGRIVYDGDSVSVVIGSETVDDFKKLVDTTANDEGLIREPKL